VILWHEWEAAPVNVNTIGRNLLFCTVRIDRVTTAGYLSHGTGFLMQVACGESRWFPALVTNKHVVEDAQRLTARIITKKSDANQPNLGDEAEVDLPPDGVIGHPDPSVDVAVVPLGPVWEAILQHCFVKPLSLSLLSTDVENFYADAIEEITFVGYPNGHRDPKHFTPIVRRGITATPLDLDMGGEPAFLVDGSVFGGSSGSPVFLLSNGIYRTAQGMVVGDRIVLVGVIAKTMLRTAQLPVEVATAPHVKIAQELNLGVAFNARAIRETLEVAVAAAGGQLSSPPASPEVPAQKSEQPTPL
jgi:trypsin-like peptidase